jgi:hypothetical protein
VDCCLFGCPASHVAHCQESHGPRYSPRVGSAASRLACGGFRVHWLTFGTCCTSLPMVLKSAGSEPVGVVCCHMICPSCIHLHNFPHVVCRLQVNYVHSLGCLLFDVALCIHNWHFPKWLPICPFTLTPAARVPMVLSRYAHTSACSARKTQAAVGSHSPQAAVVVGWGGYLHANLWVLQAVRVCTEAL